MKNYKKLIDNSISPEDVDIVIKEFINEKFDNEFKVSFEKKLKAQKNSGTTSARIISLTKRKSIMLWGSIAASFLLLILFTTMRPNGNTVRSLSSKYLDEMVISHPGVSRTISDVDLNRSEAITAFNNKEYQSAINYFDALEDHTIEDEFFMGLSYLYNSDYNLAIDKFQKTRSNPLLTQESTFLLGLALIQNGHNTAALDILKDISPGDYKYEESLSLIEKL